MWWIYTETGVVARGMRICYEIIAEGYADVHNAEMAFRRAVDKKFFAQGYYIYEDFDGKEAYEGLSKVFARFLEEEDVRVERYRVFDRPDGSYGAVVIAYGVEAPKRRYVEGLHGNRRGSP